MNLSNLLLLTIAAAGVVGCSAATAETTQAPAEAELNAYVGCTSFGHFDDPLRAKGAYCADPTGMRPESNAFCQKTVSCAIEVRDPNWCDLGGQQGIIETYTREPLPERDASLPTTLTLQPVEGTTNWIMCREAPDHDGYVRGQRLPNGFYRYQQDCMRFDFPTHLTLGENVGGIAAIVGAGGVGAGGLAITGLAAVGGVSVAPGILTGAAVATAYGIPVTVAAIGVVGIRQLTEFARHVRCDEDNVCQDFDSGRTFQMPTVGDGSQCRAIWGD